jgi:hypothetical protein
MSFRHYGRVLPVRGLKPSLFGYQLLITEEWRTVVGETPVPVPLFRYKLHRLCFGSEPGSLRQENGAFKYILICVLEHGFCGTWIFCAGCTLLTLTALGSGRSTLHYLQVRVKMTTFPRQRAVLIHSEFVYMPYRYLDISMLC